MQLLTKIYYKLTASIPRRFPETEEDVAKLKELFIRVYGLKDQSQVWYTVFSNMAAVKNTKLYVSYKELVNMAKRLDINKLLQDQKIIEYNSHLDKLKAEAKQQDEEKESSQDGGPTILPTAEGSPQWSDVPGTTPSIQ